MVLLLDQVLAQSGSAWHGLPRPDLDRERTGPTRSSVTVLVVEDDEQARELTARILRDEGYNVFAVNSGEQALECLAGGRDVQVILADIAMPGGMDGFELADRILAIAPWQRVVLMSGFAPQFPELDTARFPLLIKPFSPDQLARRIREVLEGKLH